MECLRYYYPHITITSLQLENTDSTCTAASSPDDTDSFWADFDQTEVVTNDTEALYFSRDCFAQPEENDGILSFRTTLTTSESEPIVITSIVSFSIILNTVKTPIKRLLFQKILQKNLKLVSFNP